VIFLYTAQQKRKGITCVGRFSAHTEFCEESV